jgi:hypothetical protein
MSLKLNELRATMKNRVEMSYLDWQLSQIDKQMASYLVVRDKELLKVKEDLKLIRASTVTQRRSSMATPCPTSLLEQRKSSKRSQSIIGLTRSIVFDENFENDDLFDKNNPRNYSSNAIEELKGKDPILKKRLWQMEIFKKSGRVPYFDEKVEPSLRFTKSALTRQRKALTDVSKASLSSLPKEPYHYVQQLKLQHQIDIFVKNNDFK